MNTPRQAPPDPLGPTGVLLGLTEIWVRAAGGDIDGTLRCALGQAERFIQVGMPRPRRPTSCRWVTSPGEQAADQRLPGQRAHDAVRYQARGALEALDPLLGTGSEDTVDDQHRWAFTPPAAEMSFSA